MARHALTPTCLTLVQALETHVPSALAELNLDTCRIGLSGGADSLALTAAAAWARDHRSGGLAGVRMTARVIDHGLQAGSDVVAAEARRQAESLGVSTQIVTVEVERGGLGLEAAARDARYTALEEGEDALILLAHTLDDQAETVLLGLARGSGTRSLAGMPQRRGAILRPFLGVRRSDTEQACKDWGLTWWEDPTNTDNSYTRSRVRSTMDTLEATLGPGLAQGLARTADLCRTDADYLDLMASQTSINTEGTEIPVGALRTLDPALRHRVLLTWLRLIGHDDVTRDHVLAVDTLITDWHGQKSISVPTGRVVRTSGVLTLLRNVGS